MDTTALSGRSWKATTSTAGTFREARSGLDSVRSRRKINSGSHEAEEVRKWRRVCIWRSNCSRDRGTRNNFRSNFETMRLRTSSTNANGKNPEPRAYAGFRASVFSATCLLFLGPENSPLKSSLSNSLSTCRRTSRSPFPRRLLTKA